MATLGDTVTRIVSDLNRGDGFSARATSAIVEAIEFYVARRFAFNTARANTVTQSANEYMALPADWIEVDFLRMDDGNSTYLLSEKTAEWMDERGSTASNLSQPVAYAIHDRSLRLYPVPDASYTLQMTYLRSLPEVSLSASAGATNAWLAEGFQVIYNHAMADLLETYIGGQESAMTAELHRRREREALRELDRRASLEQAPGGIKPCL